MVAVTLCVTGINARITGEPFGRFDARPGG